MKQHFRSLVFAALCLFVHQACRGETILSHRYSFNDGSGGTVTDSVGGANGIIKGVGAQWGNGQLLLPGGTIDSGAAYVELPEHLISPLKSVSFEMWVTWSDADQPEQEHIFDFGVSKNGRGRSGEGRDSLTFTPKGWYSGGLLFLQYQDDGQELNRIVLNAQKSLDLNREYHIVITYDPDAGRSQLFVNGSLVKAGKAYHQLSEFNDLNNWLGRSQWFNYYFKGSYNEFRVWDGVLTASQIAAHYSAGPNQKLGDAKPGQ